MTGSQLQELQPTNERLGRVTQHIEGMTVPVCEVVKGNLPGTAIVQTAPGDDPFYSHERLGVLDVHVLEGNKEAEIDLYAEKPSVFTQEPGVFRKVLEAVVEAEEDKPDRMIIRLSEGTRISEEVYQQTGAVALGKNTLKFGLAA